jgi:hypothetical protein
MNQVKKTWGETRNKKTTAAMAAWLLLRIVNQISPNAIEPEVQLIIYDGIELLGAIGIGDKLWRNRVKIWNGIKDIFRKRKEEAGEVESPK